MNNKIVIAIVILVSAVFFAWLVNYGWRHRYGPTETYEITEPESVSVAYKAQDLALDNADVFAGIWQDIPGVRLALMHQMTEKPWPKGLTEAVTVQAFHNNKDIFFKMTWTDDQADSTVAVDKFVDGCAMAIPLDANAPLRSIMMGFSSPVNIWHWQADKDAKFWDGEDGIPDVAVDFTYPFEEEELFTVSKTEVKSAVTDLVAQRTGSLTRKETQIVQGRGVWKDGTWSVVFKRSMTTGDLELDSQFSSASRPVSFAVWDGDESQRGSRKSVSEWVNLQIEGQPAAKSAGTQASGGNSSNDRRANKVSWIDRLGSFSLLSTAQAADSKDVAGQTDEEPRVINIQAKRFEYTPNRIVVELGELVTIRMESLDVTHGLYMDGYGINIKARPGLIGKATFVADKPGRFSFRCSETCGEFHPYMIGFMEVTPNSRFTQFVWAIGIAFAVILGIVLLKGKQDKGVEANVATE